MKKTKLLVSLLLVLIVALLCVACQDSSATTTQGGVDITTSLPGGDATTTQPVDTAVGTTAQPDLVTTPAVTTKNNSTPQTPTTLGATYGLPDEMPVIYIDTYGRNITSKEEYIPGLCSIDNVNEAFAMDEAEIEIRGRGNYSWSSTEKKSYRIKFAEKTNLLGQGNGPCRSWTLLAVHCDQSLLRTAAGFYFGRNLTGLDFISSATFAKVYLNGEYNGVYQVSDQMQVNQYRVNIDDSENDEYEIDFLVELDRNPSEIAVSDGSNTYEVKSEIYSDLHYLYIEETLTVAFSAVRRGDKDEISELLDLDSVIDSYLVEELMKNLDVGWGSFYMWQTVGGKLHFGPVWDLDLSAGNADPNDGDPAFSAPQYLYVGSSKYNYSQSNKWFMLLMKLEWFREMVKERWNEVLDIANELPKYVRAVAELYSDEFDENFVRWPIFGKQINREPSAIRKLKNHDEHAEYLAKWLETRIVWLTKCFNGEVPDDPIEGVVDFECSGGNGSKNSPYLIANANDFAAFTDALMMGAKFEGMYFLQTANINMIGYTGYNGIGSEGTFAGIYDGNGYIIKANIEGIDEAIFPYVTGVVMNVITQGKVNNTEQAAGITRSVRRGGYIINCLSTMEVISQNKNAGGIAASNQSDGGTITGCIFLGKINAPEHQVYGPINAYIDGRGGTFTYNYYISTAVGNSIAETDTAIDTIDGFDAVLNDNLAKLSADKYTSSLCTWSISGDTLTLNHK